jgi:hypothetical protein
MHVGNAQMERSAANAWKEYMMTLSYFQDSHHQSKGAKVKDMLIY